MRKSVNTKKGLDLRLKGCLTAESPERKIDARRIAIVPDDYPGFSPKPDVRAGDTVKAGQAILHDKNNPDIRLVSPVDGTVREVVRGARRHIERVEIDVTATSPAAGPEAPDFRTALQRSGLWAMMSQRPFDIVPDGASEPRDIFVTAIDTAPLEVNPSVEGRMAELEAGVKALSALTRGNVYVAVPAGSGTDIAGAVMVDVKGPHPAGCAGVIAANIAPVSKGETVWTLGLDTLARIGQLAKDNSVDWRCRVAVTGPEVKQPYVALAMPGTPMADLLEGNLIDADRPLRVISGNVLTGVNAGRDGWLHRPYRHVTVILEGSDVAEFMGWASMSPRKLSLSHSFLSWLMPRREYAPDARINGGRRAMIMSGVYERMMPMDIMPEHLVKAILSQNIEQMEALGIYEVAPEDFAAAEFADPSKLELQKIVRQGLDYIRKEV